MTAPQTVYAKCLCDDQRDIFHLLDWVPWVNVDAKTREYLPAMILRRWIRSRGGIARDERLSVTVYVYDDKTPCHPNGLPICVTATTFAVSYQEPEPCHEPNRAPTTATTKAAAIAADS